MKIKLTLLIVIIYCTNGFSQSSVADSLRRAGELDLAITEYKNVFSQDPSKRANTYDLTCALALTYYQNDSAFHYLKIALNQDSSLWALCDPDLIGMSEDARWNDIIDLQMKKYQDKNGPMANPEYAQKLLRIIMKDQALNYQIHQARSYYMRNGSFPHWYYPIATMKEELAKDNFTEMEDLVEKYGWPKYSTVGKLAADAPLLAINHHESEEVRKKYLPQIKEHCQNDEGSCMEYAKIQDRILVNTDQKQIYGMQFKYNDEQQLEPFPIVDPEYVDQRRTEIGLEPLKDYLKRKIDYDFTVVQKVK